MSKPLRERQFSFQGRYGTRFYCERSDFSAPVTIQRPDGLGETYFFRDFAEMTAYHCLNVRSQLQGFAGYDTVTFIAAEAPPGK